MMLFRRDAPDMLFNPICCLDEQGFDLRDRLNLHYRYGDVIRPIFPP